MEKAGNQMERGWVNAADVGKHSSGKLTFKPYIHYDSDSMTVLSSTILRATIVRDCHNVNEA